MFERLLFQLDYDVLFTAFFCFFFALGLSDIGSRPAVADRVITSAWIGELIVQIRSDDISIQLFSPSDGTESAAIKVLHRHSGKEVVNDSTLSQRENLRHAILELVNQMNPDPDTIAIPELTLFDRVKVQLPQSVHDGEIRDLNWDYTSAEWKYFVECSAPKVTNWYVRADLRLHEE